MSLPLTPLAPLALSFSLFLSFIQDCFVYLSVFGLIWLV